MRPLVRVVKRVLVRVVNRRHLIRLAINHLHANLTARRKVRVNRRRNTTCSGDRCDSRNGDPGGQLFFSLLRLALLLLTRDRFFFKYYLLARASWFLSSKEVKGRVCRG